MAVHRQHQIRTKVDRSIFSSGLTGFADNASLEWPMQTFRLQ